MILKCEPIVRALRSLPKVTSRKTIVLSAKGKAFTQKTALQYSKLQHLVLICGRYEGIDQRIIDFYADEERRVGNSVFMGGEVAAFAMIESISRLCPNVLGNPDSLAVESFSADSHKKWEYCQYTRPQVFEGKKVPEILLGGHHSAIAKWRQKKGTRRN